ncbi:MAG: indolepyruvate ferredoxin oxidoreductase subunit beta [Candidatus Nealsonbacteria bacterium]|nr:indolepyruvate ferredoxin oxidoreductase subunit beta [Candidatus Nealsonbacteria bacterium]
MNKNFNILIAGVGGQGAVMLTQIIAEACLIGGRDIKTSELHGLSQRGGSVETHIRFGKKIYSPLIAEGSADLILSLEITEVLRTLHYANRKTKFLINAHYLPYYSNFSQKEIIKIIEKEIKGEKYIVPASKICQEELQKEVLSGVYLLGYLSYKELIPLKPNLILKAISKVVPEKYLELNKKAFEIALN